MPKLGIFLYVHCLKKNYPKLLPYQVSKKCEKLLLYLIKNQKDIQTHLTPIPITFVSW